MERLDFERIREKVAGKTGRDYWRSLDELAGSEDFFAYLKAEFPRQVEALEHVDRRQFMKLMGASLALAGLGACTTQPPEKVVPYVKPPEELVPGDPVYFATAMPLLGTVTGLLVESHVGRPTKIEGNPQHPASMGATDAITQASILGLYDPDRSQVVRRVDEILSWEAFQAALTAAMQAQTERGGAGLRILTQTVGSPTLAAQIDALLQKYPGARWHQYEPLARDNAVAGARLAFGDDVETLYRFDQADVVVSLDADFLSSGGGHVRYARDFIGKRRLTGGSRDMNRLYVVEPTPSNTGVKADQRLALRASRIPGVARALAAGIGISVAGADAKDAAAAWVAAAVADLKAHAGRSIVIAGDQQPAEVHAVAHAINAALGNVGKTVIYTEPVVARPEVQRDSLAALVKDMQAGKVELLLIIGGNPVYDAPADLDFAAALEKVAMRAHLSLFDDETSRLCQWHLPEAHYLESWSDGRAFDGTASVMQPLIAPLYSGRSAHELLAMVAGQGGAKGYDIVRDFWKKKRGDAGFEVFWTRSLNDGVVADSAAAIKRVALRADLASALPKAAAAGGSSDLEIVFRPDPTILDGRFSNLGWLQELPKPLSKLTWDNAVELSPHDAERLGIVNTDVVELELGGRKVQGAVWIAPGQADGVVTVTLGYGRTRAGRVGTGTGFDAYRLRTTAAPDQALGLVLAKTGDTYQLACTQHHGSLEGRNIVRAANLEEYRAHPHVFREMGEDPPSDATMYPAWPYTGYAWGMAVDMNACIGCNACVIACVAENNIAVVGKEQVANGREMQWIRVDRYYVGEPEDPEVAYQPMFCQHCELAPCETVCPVNATVHDEEGLNVMVYNRCVGTRYCSNNCPYKVRRFNFYRFTNYSDKSLELQRNPDVTVRSRGVMEKCTYCVQRINHARIAAKREDRKVKDGEIVTACQQTCPTDALVFGDINDEHSRVAKLKAEQRNYAVLGEINTRPRTTYLAIVRNPNPALGEKEPVA
ncbi:TAT-variant-translocated molybdopterin oxidoreductase [Candidatus Binatia bacterium]|nr:TAT-variant-translocated molybdopterin oxidoreductase [Candidatus Binatia bacterium]